MQDSLSFLRSNRIYFTGFLCSLLAGFLLMLFAGKAATFIFLNAYHPYWLNVLFINYTFMGDGFFALCLIVLYLFYFKKRKQGLALLFAFLLSGTVVQVIKNFTSSPRPKLFFEAGRYLHFIDDVSLANNSSFPSGHTATAFAIATVLILMMKNKKWQLPILIAAALVGYSRIYLAQHFLAEVLVGACIGISTAVLSYIMVTSGIKVRRFRKTIYDYPQYGNIAYNQSF